MKHKKLIGCCLSFLLCGMFMVPVIADESSSTSSDGKYVVSVECYKDKTYHQINARNGASYPSGTAYVYHSFSGAEAYTSTVKGTSGPSYWNASHVAKVNETILHARTEGYGVKVRANN